MATEPNTSGSKGRESRVIDERFVSHDNPSHFGTIIGILIAVLTLVFIGLYIWSQLMTKTTLPAGPTIERPTPAENNEPESTTSEAKTEILDIVSTSDELSAIEADLEATDMGDVEADLQAIEAELGE